MNQCDGCRFWERFGAGSITDLESYLLSDEEDDKVLVGKCRRHPPQIVSEGVVEAKNVPLFKGVKMTLDNVGILQGATQFPVTWEHDWCGEFQKEIK